MAAELFAKYSCTNCQEEILGVTVHCSECEDFSLCLQCFAAGAEIGPHKNDHSYQFTDTNLATSVSRGKNIWSPREKLRLLDAIEIYSFGNWEDISKHIETRSAEDSKEEYINKYLNGAIGRHTWLQLATEHRPQLVDHTVDDKGPLSQLLTQRLPPLDVTPKEAAELQYMPNRNDFEREYDPSAEQLVSTLSICPDDDEADIAIKLAQVDIYVRRLRERTRRKRLVRDYQLIFNFFRGNLRRKQSKDQREFRDRFRVFAQFFTAMEFDRRIGSFEREKALRVRLSELCRYRWNGLQRLEECVHFEQHAASIHKNTGPYGLQGRTLACIIGPNGQRMPGCIRQCLTGQPSQWRTAPVVYALSSKKGENERTANSNFTGQKFMHHTADPVYSDGSSLNKNSSDSYQLLVPQQSPANNNVDPPQQQQPGVNLLSSNEIQLCSKLNLPATRYITLKTVLLSGAQCQINTVAENCIKKYLIQSGWLQQTSTGCV